MLDTFQDILKKSLLTGERTFMDGFGVFETRLVPERVGEHPINGNRVVIPAMREVVLKASQDLKKEINPR